jgi:hypothetical protein
VVLCGCHATPSPSPTIQLDPTRPTFTITEAQPEPGAEVHDFGPFALMLPPQWEIEAFDVGSDQPGYALTGPGVDPGSCTLDVKQWTAGEANDVALAWELDSTKSRLPNAPNITDTSLGYVDWEGMPRMTYSRNHRDYTNAPAGEYLTFTTYDPSHTYTFGISISVPEGDPADTMCYRVWTTLEVH